MSFQEKAQHQISQLDKEVSVARQAFPAVAAVAISTRYHDRRPVITTTALELEADPSAAIQLSKYPALVNLEKQTNVPKVYAILGVGAVYFFLIFFNIAGEFLVNVVGFALPGYYSLEALFSASKVDDTQVRLSRRELAPAHRPALCKQS